MEPLAIVATALAGIKTAGDLAKGLAKSVSASKDASLRQGILDLYDAMLNSKSQIDALADTIREREHRIAELEGKLKLRGQVKFEPPLVWLLEGSTREGPFCQVCLECDDKLIHLHDHQGGGHICKVCNNVFYPKGFYNLSNGKTQDWDPLRR